MELDRILNNHELYVKIQRLELLDSLLTDYLAAHETKDDGSPGQGHEVKLMREKDDLSSRAVIFHEKCEIAAYLDLGYTEDEIRNGTAHKNSYERAHNIAEKVELELLQHVGIKSMGVRLPLYSIFPTRPAVEKFDSDFSTTNKRLHHYISNGQLFKLYGGAVEFNPLRIDVEDIRKSFRLFEEFGSSYTDPDFKRNCERFVENYVKRKNSEYESLKQSNLRKLEQTADELYITY